MVESCSTCLHRDKEMDELPCSECQRIVGIDDITRTKYKRKIVTNADRIRSMSVEELAEWHETCPYIDEECTMKGCLRCVREWLQQPWEVDE